MTKTDAVDVIEKRIMADQFQIRAGARLEMREFITEQDTALGIALAALKNPLLAFVEEEVPFRLENCLDLDREYISDELVDACVEYLYENSDVLFDYDAIDSALIGICAEHNIGKGE